MLSIFDIFKIGIGPSSSHTVGPMRIARRFLNDAQRENTLGQIEKIEISLHGSLALTGIGHGVDKAVILGLSGFVPEETDPRDAALAIEDVKKRRVLSLLGARDISFDPKTDIHYRTEIIPTIHPNEMVLRGIDGDGKEVLSRTLYSVGGGFIASARQLEAEAKDDMITMRDSSPFNFGSAEELLGFCRQQDTSVEAIVLANEDAMRPRAETSKKLDRIWDVMEACINRGLETQGVLPGGLNVNRRAPNLYLKLREAPLANEREQLFDWLNVYAMAVNEENAAGGQVVTAPTNGAAGIIPSVIMHYCCEGGTPNRDHIRRFLIVAAAIGMLYKQRASILSLIHI